MSDIGAQPRLRARLQKMESVASRNDYTLHEDTGVMRNLLVVSSMRRSVSFLNLVIRNIARPVSVCLLMSGTSLHAVDVPYTGLVQVLDAYAKGQFNVALAQLVTFTDYHSLTSRFRNDSPKWIAAGSQSKEWRTHVAAVVALEITHLGLRGERLGAAQFDDAMKVVEHGSSLVRTGEPNSFEHMWLLASVALIQGAQNYWLASSGDAAFFKPPWRAFQSRFPTEGRFRLAEILTKPEARRMPNRTGTSAFSMTNGDMEASRSDSESAGVARVKDAIQAYGRLVDDPAIAAEARLRRAILLFHRNDLPGVLADVQIAIATSSDPYIKHVGLVYQALALDALGQSTEAIDVLESALQVVPHARSAAMVLAEDLFAVGRRQEAAELLQATLGSPAPHDPWLEFSAGDYRFWASDLQQLREAIRP